jgi:hypothetical protein
MKSPFPGMDPFLEQPTFWSDFHSTFINYWREAIADALPPRYEATIGERVYLVEHDPEMRRLGFPDVAVVHDDLSASPSPGSGSSSGTAILEPVTIPLAILEGPRETYLEIVHLLDQSLVASLELLSPSTKEQPGRTEYLAKRRALIYQKVHLIELDLRLEGRRVQEPLPSGDYYYLVSHGDRRPDCDVSRWTLREPLPTVPIPLRAPDRDVSIDLGAVFATAYARARFSRRINYQGPLPQVIRKDDQPWVESVLQTCHPG